MTKADTGAVAYYNDVAFHAIAPLTEDQEIILFDEREKIKDDPSKKDQLKKIDDVLVLSVIKMANELAIRFASKIPGIDVKDAIQEANEALIDSIRLYNPNARTKDGLRIKFRTYAHYRTEYKIKEFIMNNSRLVRLPRGKLDDLFLLLGVIENLTPEDTVEDLMEKINKKGGNMNIEETYKALELLQGIHTSLDQTVRNDSVGKDQTLKDIIPVPEDVPNQEEELNRKMSLELLNKKVMETLKPYNDATYDVLYYRFLDPSLAKIRTYEETANVLFRLKITERVLSREWIRQLEGLGISRVKETCPELEELM